MFSLQAFAKEQKFKYAKHAVVRTWRTPRRILDTVPQRATVQHAFVVTKSSQSKRKGRCIAQMNANVAPRHANAATKSLLCPKKPLGGFVARNVTMRGLALSELFATGVMATKSSKFPKARPEQNANMGREVTSGCGNIAGLCNRNLADLWSRKRTCTISTATEQTIGRRTLNFGSALSPQAFARPTTIAPDARVSVCQPR